jgi:O-antigen/teichoic acid export membrane protein
LIDKFEHIEKTKISWGKIRDLLVLGFPIVVNSYLMLYINNVSKYTIDKYCTQGDVAIFNVLYMPVFCINLLMGFITRPMITVLAKKADEKKKKDILNILGKEIAMVIGITLIVIGGMYLIGLTLLEILYSMELHAYRKELMLLLLGGAFYATYTIFYYMITILRKQFALLVSCCIGALIALCMMPKLVSRFGMLGAAGGYAVIMFLIMLICMLFVVIYLHKMERTKK